MVSKEFKASGYLKLKQHKKVKKRMKDERGLYYYPHIEEKNIRMYVRKGENGEIEFRMYNANVPEVWDRHHWIPLDVVRTAARMYAQKKQADPMRLYDEAVAKQLIAEDNA